MATDDRRRTTDDGRTIEPAVQTAVGRWWSVFGGRPSDFRAGFVAALPLWLEDGGSLAYQYGANLRMFGVWQSSTTAVILLGNLLPNPSAYGLDLIFPLTFIGLLVPLLRNPDGRKGERVSVSVALLAAVLT